MHKQTTGSGDGAPAFIGDPLGEHGKRLLYGGILEKGKTLFLSGDM